MGNNDAILGRTESTSGGHLPRCYRGRGSPAHALTSFSTASSVSWQAQGLQWECRARARLHAAQKHSGPASLRPGEEELAEELWQHGSPAECR